MLAALGGNGSWSVEPIAATFRGEATTYLFDNIHLVAQSQVVGQRNGPLVAIGSGYETVLTWHQEAATHEFDAIAERDDVADAQLVVTHDGPLVAFRAELRSLGYSRRVIAAERGAAGAWPRVTFEAQALAGGPGALGGVALGYDATHDAAWLALADVTEPPYRIEVARRTAPGTWVREVVPGPGTIRDSLALVVDNADVPHVLYVVETNDGYALVAADRSDNGASATWTTTTVAALGPAGAVGLRLAAGLDGALHALWGSGEMIMAARRDALGGAWEIEVADSGPAAAAGNLILDGDGHLQSCWYRSEGTRTADGWTRTMVAPTAGRHSGPCTLALMPGGTVAFARSEIRGVGFGHVLFSGLPGAPTDPIELTDDWYASAIAFTHDGTHTHVVYSGGPYDGFGTVSRMRYASDRDL